MMNVTQPQKATAVTPGIVLPVYIAQLAASSRLNLSPKVTIPALVGFSSLSLVCELQKYHITLDWQTVAYAVISIMVALGVIVSDNNQIVKASTQHALNQAEQAEGDKINAGN